LHHGGGYKVFISGLALGFLTAQNKQPKLSDINVILAKSIEKPTDIFCLKAPKNLTLRLFERDKNKRQQLGPLVYCYTPSRVIKFIYIAKQEGEK
jgi:hypothetical protein